MSVKNKKSAPQKVLGTEPQGEIILFQSEDGHTKVQVRFEDKNVWLTQAAIAKLFQTTPQNIPSTSLASLT